MFARMSQKFKLRQFFAHVACDRVSLLQPSTYCSALCTFGFVNGFMFSYNGPDGGMTLPQQHRCNLVHGLKPLLRGIGCVVLDRTWKEAFEACLDHLPIYSRCTAMRWNIFIGLQKRENIYGHTIHQRKPLGFAILVQLVTISNSAREICWYVRLISLLRTVRCKRIYRIVPEAKIMERNSEKKSNKDRRTHK